MPSKTDIKKDVNRGLAWVGMASSMVGVLDLVALVLVLKFWISPAEYGIATLAITLFPILDMATDMGLSAAVIQRDDHTDEKISTVFWLNLMMSLLMFAAIALVIGPGLSWFHGSATIGAMLTVYGTKLIWQNVYFMPSALMRRELRFKELSVVRVFANIAEFAGKVGFAPLFGVWCFVLGPLCRVLVTGIGTQICHPWRPRFVLRFREALDWFTFGVKTSASQILFYIYTNVDYQVVGYYFGQTALGFYRLAYDIVLDPCRIMGDVVTQIAFPTFSRMKTQTARLVDQFISFTRMNLVVMLGFLGIVFVGANELILLFWNADWLDAVPALHVLCLVGVLRALSFIVPPLLDGIGKPALTLTYTLVASVALPLSFVIAGEMAEVYDYDFMAVAWAWAIGYPIAFAVLFAIAFRQLSLSLWTYVRKIVGIPVCAAIAMGLSAGALYVASPLPIAVRFAISTAVMTGVFFVLLAYFQGISPKTIKAALSSDPPKPAADAASGQSAQDNLDKRD